MASAILFLAICVMLLHAVAFGLWAFVADRHLKTIERTTAANNLALEKVVEGFAYTHAAIQAMSAQLREIIELNRHAVPEKPPKVFQRRQRVNPEEEKQPKDEEDGSKELDGCDDWARP